MSVNCMYHVTSHFLACSPVVPDSIVFFSTDSVFLFIFLFVFREDCCSKCHWLNCCFRVISRLLSSRLLHHAKRKERRGTSSPSTEVSNQTTQTTHQTLLPPKSVEWIPSPCIRLPLTLSVLPTIAVKLLKILCWWRVNNKLLIIFTGWQWVPTASSLAIPKTYWHCSPALPFWGLCSSSQPIVHVIPASICHSFLFLGRSHNVCRATHTQQQPE